MTASELSEVLQSVARHAEALRRHVADLEAMAFEAAVVDTEKVMATRMDYSLDTVGDPYARKVYQALAKRAKEADDIFAGLRSVVLNMMSKGPSADLSRGSLIALAEHDALIGRQRAREQAEREGHPLAGHTPTRMTDQPRHPGRR